MQNGEYCQSVKYDFLSPLVFRTFDKDNDGFVSVKEWIEGLSVFLRGTMDEQIQCTLSPDIQSKNVSVSRVLIPLCIA